MKLRIDMRDGLPIVVYAFDRGVAGNIYKEEKTMVDPISAGGPDTGPADEKPPLRHPGFYTGEDYVEWAKNRIACLDYNSAVFASTPKLEPVQRQMLDQNNKELAMMKALAEKAGIVL